MKRILPVVTLAFPFLVVDASAAPVATYIFDNGGGTFLNTAVNFGESLTGKSLSVLNPNLSATTWTTEDGTPLEANGLNSASGRAIGSRSWDDNPATLGVIEGNAFLFEISVQTGYELDLNAFSFGQQGSNGAQGLGPEDWQFWINETLVDGGNGELTRGSLNTISGSLALTNLTGTITFRLFATGAEPSVDSQGNPVPASNATWRVDNFALEGDVTAVPLPASVWLLGSAIVPLFLRRRGRV